MPITIHSTARRVKRDSPSVELQDLLVCLGLVFAFTLTAFGIAKLTEVLRTRTPAENAETETSQESLLKITPRSSPPPAAGYLAHAVLTLSSAGLVLFPRKARPQDSRTGKIQYIKASPHLQHISAPRSYAFRHRRRLCFNRPGPTLLRNVITATPHGKLASSTVGVVQRSAARVVQIQKTHHTHSPLERPAANPTPGPAQATPAVSHIEIPPVCLGPDSPHAWPAVETLHGTADSVVGAHPSALPLRERPAQAAPQTVLWTAPSGVGANANFKFGLVRGVSAALGARPSPAHASIHRAKTMSIPHPASPEPASTRRLCALGNANVKTTSIKEASKAKTTAGYTAGMKTDRRKENVAVC
ncbi:hypothetical protein B0H14DRAFT_3429213 [Mycena olivaceomarginata]|nr:hypothetical protein B0H14DRAFT_3429213 [Mycena olivaceomarginata]